MLTLIGRGGHGLDIAHSLKGQPFNWVEHHSEPTWSRNSPFILGINNPRLRAEVSEELNLLDKQWIHRDAKLYAEVQVGHGTHINYGAMMTRTKLGRHCTISPGVTICGDVVIGDEVLIGAGAVICNLVTIGDGATVAAGAVVPPRTNLPPGVLVKGIPAR